MSALSVVLLLVCAPILVVLCGTVLVVLAGLRREVATIRTRVTEDPGATRARIREAVTEALAEERERELAEARAFWAAQEAQSHASSAFPEPSAGSAPVDVRAEFERQFGDALREAIDELALDESAAVVQDTLRDDAPGEPADGDVHQDTADHGAVSGLARGDDKLKDAAPDRGDELAHPEGVCPPAAEAAPRLHPSHPDFRPAPALADRQRTLDRLEHLAERGVPLTDVRSGPLGTLDVYVFADDTMLCVTPGDREASRRLGRALDGGAAARLLGGSGLGGGYTLTFGVDDASVFVIADRVVASA